MTIVVEIPHSVVHIVTVVDGLPQPQYPLAMMMDNDTFVAPVPAAKVHVFTQTGRKLDCPVYTLPSWLVQLGLHEISVDEVPDYVWASTELMALVAEVVVRNHHRYCTGL